jgi:putative membrane protein
MRSIFITLVAATALTACGTTGDDAATTETAAATTPVADPSNPLGAPGYMMMAASSDQFEIQSSQLALQASQNPAVQSYARLMIAHHQATTANLTQAAQAAGLTPPPPALMPTEQALLDQVRAAGSGPAFDAAYKQAQIAGHQNALQLHQGYANGGDVPSLRQTAATAVPIVQQHLVGAQQLSVEAMMQQQPGAATMGTTPADTAPVRSGERG